MDVKSAGERVYWHRSQREWTQHELASRSGVSATTISNIETGVTHPQLNTMRRLARAFGSSTEEFLYGPGPEEAGSSKVDLTKHAQQVPLEELFTLKDELLRVQERLSERIPLPKPLQRRLGQNPQRWTPEDRRNFHEYVEVNRALAVIFDRLATEAQHELS